MSSTDPGSSEVTGAGYGMAPAGPADARSEVPAGGWPEGVGDVSSTSSGGAWHGWAGEASSADAGGASASYARPGGEGLGPDSAGAAWLGGDSLAGPSLRDRAVPPGGGAAGRDRAPRRGGDGAAGLPAVRLGSLPRRRRPGMIALAFALVGAGVLASATLYQRVNRQIPVLLVTAPVPAGDVITAADLATATVAAGPGIRLIPAGQLPRVIGLVAAGPLQPGTLLAPSQLTSALPPAAGQVIVPVPVKPSMLPASGLAGGDQVEVVPVAGAQPAALGRPVSAIVQAVTRTPDQDGSDVIDLLVASRSGPALARQAASGQLALVVTHRSR